MAKSKEALDQWLEGLKTQGKLSDEKLAVIKEAFEGAPEAAEYAGGSVLRQEDYSRHQEALRLERQEMDSHQIALAEWKNQAEAEYFEMQRQKAAAETEVERLKQLAKTYVPESELGKVTTVNTPIEKKEPEAPFDTSEFIKAKDAQEAMLNTLKVQNQLMSIGAQHQKLFGEPLDDAELIDRAITNKRTIDQEWVEHYKVADKRAELGLKVQEAHDQKIREEERAKVLSELKLPDTRPGVPRSPVLTIDAANKPAETADERRSGIQAALEAYGAGTYRTVA